MATNRQKAYTDYFNKGSSIRKFSVGDQVFIFIPDSNNKIYVWWTGTEEIIEFCPPHAYKVKFQNGTIKPIHVNKLKKFYPRINAIGIRFEEESDFGDIQSSPKNMQNEKNEVFADIKLSHPQDDEKLDLEHLLKKYETLFRKNVRVTTVDPHKIHLIQNAERKPYMYRIPESLKSKIDEQINELLELGLKKIIEESSAEIAHPVVCVKKTDSNMCGLSSFECWD